ncbi:hypothetical protein M2D07_006585 [Pseudomonas sp. BGr12]|uniref:hypothetical protein n=1 Tax=Pseudomonas sp. BGr12 TaxID=2936269 RepID=UPI002559EED9|nr:hypothetical protein [Pseudomonas sp. BJa5]MDL2426681.1 hypothetical protein [Pseudomonas sp. BJa5]
MPIYLIHEVFPPRGFEDGALSLRFRGAEDGQEIIIGAQGVLAGEKARPVQIELPDWCGGLLPDEHNLAGGIYRHGWKTTQSPEPYVVLRPADHAPQGPINVGNVPLELYLQQVPPLLAPYPNEQ